MQQTSLVTLTTYPEAREQLRIIAALCKESRKDTLRRLIAAEYKRLDIDRRVKDAKP